MMEVVSIGGDVTSVGRWSDAITSCETDEDASSNESLMCSQSRSLACFGPPIIMRLVDS